MVFVVKSRDLLLDVSRLLWRAWDRKLPTGIDRVCLEYIRRFGSRSRGVVQFRGFTRVLSSQDSARLFAILGESNSAIRTRLLLLLPLALAMGLPYGPAAFWALYLVLSFAAALALHIAVERPFLMLKDMLAKRPLTPRGTGAIG